MIVQSLADHLEVFSDLQSIAAQIEEAGRRIRSAVLDGHKILLCGNGGSAADCQHFAAEMTGRFSQDRQPLPAIALTTDTSALTAIGNDYGYQAVFERQVRALGRKGDVLIALSTSGKSVNVLLALDAARNLDMFTVLLTGAEDPPWKLGPRIRVPSTHTPRIQEAHAFVLHCWAQEIDRFYAPHPAI